ncbi:MAG TPA: class I SAM-dependent methyltransferase [Burkholderiales bacterium]|nr:class I SAM-dependent methyltransferase [Burkholderiales bacterium]
MNLRRKTLRLAGGLAAACAFPRLIAQTVDPKNKLGLEVDFVPTPHEIVDAMLKLANVNSSDLVYDLGCGDGRIVIAAAHKFGARGVGIDIDPDRIRDAVENARAAGVADRVRFVQGDLFEADFRDATVVTLFLKWNYNRKLRPRLWDQLKPGTPVVSHEHDFGPDWPPAKRIETNGETVYLYVVPERKRPAATGSFTARRCAPDTGPCAG